MTNILTLDKLREDVERDFAPVKIGLSDGTEVTLRNLLRLNKKDREAVLEKLKGLEEAQKDGAEVSVEELDKLTGLAEEVLGLIADNGRKLVKELDGDFALVMKVLEAWMEATQPGEAEPSPN